jgi:hypothetical protein
MSGGVDDSTPLFIYCRSPFPKAVFTVLGPLNLKTEAGRGEMAQGFETGGVANGQGVFNQYLAVHLQLIPGQMIASDYPFLFRFSG